MSTRFARPRSRTRTGRSRHRRGRVAFGVVVGAAIVVGGGVLLANDAQAVRRALADGKTHVAAAHDALADGHSERARRRLAQARAATEDADQRTNRLLWQVAGRVPLAGRSVRIVDAVVDVADAAITVGGDAAVAAGQLLGEDGRPELQVVEGRVELAPLRLVGDTLDQLSTDRLERAVGELDAIPSAWVPAEIQEGRRRALDLGGGALTTVQRVEALVDVLPGFLGGDGPRRYFLAMQNSAELRGTGGLIGLFSVLTVDGGAFSLSEPQVYGVLDRDPDEPEEPQGPVPTGDEFAARYAHVNAAGFFANVNVDPDLPTTSRVLLDLYALRTGERLHGVVAMDPIGLATLLEEVGPVALPPDAAHPSLPNPVPPGQVAPVTMIDIYDVFGDDHAARKAWLKAFAVAAFEQVFGGAWDGVAMGRRAAIAADRGHLQLFSEVEAEQSAFEEVGLAGRMAPRAVGDLLAVTANNAGGNKMDVHVGHTISADVRLSRVGDDATAERDATVRIGLDNPLPAAGRPDYIIGNCLLNLGRDGCHAGPPGLNRTWFTVWTPDSTQFSGARAADGSRLLVAADRIHGHHAFDHHLETPAESTNHFEIDVSGPVALARDGDDLVYRITVPHQAKAVPDRLALDVHAPRGWHPVHATVTGGGDGSGLGVHAEPGPAVTVRIEGDRVRVTGDVNADVYVSVRLARPWSGVWERVEAWLRRPAS